MKMRIGLAAVGVGIAVANLSACADAPQTPHDQNVETAFNEITQHWNGRGFSLLGETNLVTVGPNEVYECAGEKIYTTRGKASYCPPENDVVISLDSYNRLVAKAEERPEGKQVTAIDTARFILAHELGHGTQHNNQKIKVEDPAVEYEADCISALAMKKLYPESATKENASNFYKSLDQVDGDSHGTTEGRINAYNTGLENNACPSPFPVH